MVRRIIAIVFLVIAAAGLVYGILGITKKEIKIETNDFQGVYNVKDDSLDGQIVWSTAGGITTDTEAVKSEARSIRTRQIVIGFVACGVAGIIGGCLMRKKQEWE